jgi:pyruvate/2-oxoglutarate dehydrogenase complex dihydrolipoamide dehydrogenase (E3) component
MSRHGSFPNSSSSGTTLIFGHGHFIGPELLEVDMRNGSKRCVTGKQIVIGTGTRASVDKIPGPRCFQSTHTLAMTANTSDTTRIDS